MKFKSTAGVYVNAAYGPDAVADVEKSRSLSGLCITPADMSSVGYTKIGEADIEVTLFSKEIVIRDSVDTLRKEQSKVRAEAESKVQHIEDRIQSMLAICYDASVA